MMADMVLLESEFKQFLNLLFPARPIRPMPIFKVEPDTHVITGAIGPHNLPLAIQWRYVQLPEKTMLGNPVKRWVAERTWFL